MRNTIENIIDDYNFEGYLKLVEQKTPKRVVYEYMDMFYLYWNIFRGNVEDNRTEILKWLGSILRILSKCVCASGGIARVLEWYRLLIALLLQSSAF